MRGRHKAGGVWVKSEEPWGPLFGIEWAAWVEVVYASRHFP